MILNRFDGGKSIRLDSSLIAANEGVTYTNIDNSKGALVPLKDVGTAVEFTGKFGTYFNAAATWIVDISNTRRTALEKNNLLYRDAPTLDSDDIWTYVTTPVVANDICWSRTLSLFVAVGTNTVMTSPDGITWTSRTPAANRAWQAVCWSPSLNLFAAVCVSGTGNRVMTSPDGITWTSRTTPADSAWGAITWQTNANQFVAVAYVGTSSEVVMTSPDGITWTLRTVTSASGWYGITSNTTGSILVAVAYNGTSTDSVMTSADGITWTDRTSFTGQWRDVCWAAGSINLFVAVGSSGFSTTRIMTSPDGINWTLRSNPANMYFSAVKWNGTKLVAVGYNTVTSKQAIVESPDGITWTEMFGTPHNSNITGLAANTTSGRFVGVTSDSNNLVALVSHYLTDTYATYTNSSLLEYKLGIDKPTLALSAAIENFIWSTSTSPANFSMTDVLWSSVDNLLVAVNSNTTTTTGISTSADGITWTARATPNAKWLATAYNGSTMYVGVGIGVAMSSPDAITWTARTPANTYNWVDVAYGNSLFVAVASSGAGDRVMSSADGTTWTARSLPADAATNLWYNIVHDGDKFVAIGYGGGSSTKSIVTSYDGVTWLSYEGHSGGAPKGLAFSGTVFASAMYNKQVWYSNNGTDWHLATTLECDSILGNIFWTGELFLIPVSISGNTCLFASVDGISWYNISTIGTGLAAYTGIFALNKLFILGFGDAYYCDFTLGNLVGTYTYTYTYYNNNNGNESAPAPLAIDINTVKANIVLSNIAVPVDYQVTHKRIYRVGGERTEFSLVATIAAATITYTDSIADADIPGDLLVTDDNLAAPYNLKYITEYNNMLFGAVNNTLRFTPIGEYHNWPAAYSVTFDKNLTGLVVVGSSLVVFTLTNSYLVNGTAPLNLAKLDFSNYGCTNHHAIKKINTSAIWPAINNICMTNGSVPVNVSIDKLGNTDFTTTLDAAVNKDVYYLLKPNSVLQIFDFRFNQVNIVDYANGIINSLNYGNNKLLVSDTNLANHELFAGVDNISIYYKSPVITEGTFLNRKSYKHMYMRSSGSVTITIFIDGANVYSSTFTTEDTHDLQVPQDTKDGYSIQFMLTGTGEVKEIGYNLV